LATIAVLIAAALLWGPFTEARFASTDPNASAEARSTVLVASDEARFAGGAAALPLFLSDPIFGVGFGLYHFASAIYLSGNPTTYAHSWYLDVLAEQGLVGVVLAAIASWLLVVRVLRAPPMRLWLALAILVAYAIGCAFTESPPYLPTSGVAWLAVGGALAVAISSRRVGTALLPDRGALS
jgi:O-antigen ligase